VCEHKDGSSIDVLRVKSEKTAFFFSLLSAIGTGIDRSRAKAAGLKGDSETTQKEQQKRSTAAQSTNIKE